MTVDELMARLESLGIELHSEQGRLRVSAPRGSMTHELKEAIAARKDGLLEALARRATHRATDRSRALVRLDRRGPLPVSVFQERLWILQRIDPSSTAFNIVSVWTLKDVPSAEAVVNALRAMLERHEILRSKLEETEAGLVSRVMPVSEVPLQASELGALDETQVRPIVEGSILAETQKPFDLTTGVPVRVTVFHVAPSSCVVLFSAHHIAVDAWSMALLERELREGCRTGAPPAMPPFQYADFAGWQRAASSDALPDLEWWAQRLAGAPQTSVFPPDRLDTGRETGETRTFVWEPDLANPLRAHVRKHGVTVYMALIAAMATVLRWHTEQEDFVFGSPMGVRDGTDLESMVGPFVNLLLLRIDATGDPSFDDLLARVRNALLDAHDHRHVPFESVLERVKPPRSFDHSPLFQIALVHHNTPAETGSSFGGGAMHEMTIFLRDEAGDRLSCAIEYRSNLYSRAAVERVAAHMEAVLRRAVENGERRLSELCVLPDDERLRLIDTFNATAAPREGVMFPARFEERVSRNRDAVAVTFQGEPISYGDLDRRANQLARRLTAAGAGRGTLVGICLQRSTALVATLLAVQKAGAAYVPLDPGFPPERLAFMLADSGARVLVTDAESAERLEPPASVVSIDLDAEASAIAALSDAPLGIAVQENDPAYVIYTSGSTGRPKGVVVPHRALINFLISMEREPGIAVSDVLAAVTTISFDIAGLELYLPLLTGASIDLVPREIAADGADLAQHLAKSGATMLQATPATWRMLLEADWQPPAGFRALCGGEALPRDLADALLERVAELWNLYGPTETTIWSTVGRVLPGHDGIITIGRPIDNTQVYLRDKRGGLVPLGMPGELCIGGDGVALGYHNRPELTIERFIADPWSGRHDSRLYRTGDLARWQEDGTLVHLGRMDHQVKVRGFRIELGEIESVLAEHEAVRQAVVLAREAGPGDIRLVAYIVYAPGQELTVTEVRRHLRTVLPDYMIPSLVVSVDAIPLTPNGKVDRAALPDPFRAAALGAGAYQAPTSAMEQMMAAIWADVLKVDRVGANDNFFELGGHSLLSLRVVAAVEKQSGWRMDPRVLFFQSLAQIAAMAGSAPRTELATR